MKRTILVLFGVLAAACSLCAQSDSFTLTVTVTNMKSTDGVLNVTLFNTTDKWLEDGKKQQVSIADSDKVTVEFTDVKPGTYAVSVTHDENNNGRLDANSMGLPTERYGFSNNARNMFGPASFEESSFELLQDTAIEIKIK